jgi:hypothetical protein
VLYPVVVAAPNAAAIGRSVPIKTREWLVSANPHFDAVVPTPAAAANQIDGGLRLACMARLLASTNHKPGARAASSTLRTEITDNRLRIASARPSPSGPLRFSNAPHINSRPLKASPSYAKLKFRPLNCF